MSKGGDAAEPWVSEGCEFYALCGQGMDMGGPGITTKRKIMKLFERKDLTAECRPGSKETKK